MDIYEFFKSFPDEIKWALLCKFNEYYKFSKSHTIAVVPFFGLLCRYGNEARPLLNHTDMNTRYFMTSGFNGFFKDTIVYPGYNPFITSDQNELSALVDFQSKQQHILSSIFNKSIGIKSIDEEKLSYQEILKEYKMFLDNFDEMCEKYPSPYKIAFDIKDTDELINYLSELYSDAKKDDELARVLLVYPTSLCFLQQLDYKKTVDFMSTINGDLYLGHSCADQYLDKISPSFFVERAFDSPIVHSLQDFATTYNMQISQEALEAFSLEIEKIYNMINGNDSENSQIAILNEIEQIDTDKVYKEHNLEPQKSYKKVQQ